LVAVPLFAVAAAAARQQLDHLHKSALDTAARLGAAKLVSDADRDR
jgi:hypothetical protein